MRARRESFRYSSAVSVAAVITLIAGLSVATWAPYLLGLLVIPLLVGIWNWRVGTDADGDGLTVHAVFGRRRIPWAEVSGLVSDARGRISAQLTSGGAIALPAVSTKDLPRLVAASGQELVTDPR
jgi:MFS superfamily sulfate permease-like transporter